MSTVEVLGINALCNPNLLLLDIEKIERDFASPASLTACTHYHPCNFMVSSHGCQIRRMGRLYSHLNRADFYLSSQRLYHTRHLLFSRTFLHRFTSRPE